MPYRKSRRVERQQRKEWQAANHYHSPHNDIFERQCSGIEANLKGRYGDSASIYQTFNFVEPYLPDQVLAQIERDGFDKVVVYPWLVVDSVFTSGLVLEQINKALAANGEWLGDMRYLPSFWERADFQQRMSDQIIDGIAPLVDQYPPSQIGIALCLHGCPLESKGQETGARESTALYHAMQERLINRFPLMTPAWMNHPVPGT
ncbi:MAG: ferrochelatase [Acidimicrobiia bacterium]